MPGDYFSISREDLISRVRDLGALHDSTAAAHSEIEAALASVGPVWGSDDIGDAWRSAYTASAIEVMLNAMQVPHQVEALSANLARTVREYSNTEDENTAASSEVGA